MYRPRQLASCVRNLAVALLMFLPQVVPSILAGQENKERVTRILWRDPGVISERDLSWNTDPANQPPRPPFTYVEEDTSGTTPKVLVEDANGTTWSVKLSGTPKDAAEVHAEIAAVRLTWALGYLVEKSYYVPEGRIEAVGKLTRASRAIGPDGGFSVARFEERPEHAVRTGDGWSFDRNPFIGTKELSGLMILMTMLNNWDLRGSANTTVLKVKGDRPELWYVVSDHGASFGRMDGATLFRQRTKWNLDDFRQQKFIDGVRGRLLDLHFVGDGAIDVVPLDHARWFAGLVTQLTADRLRQAFEAAGATPAEIDGFSARLLEKIRELETAVK